MPDRVIPKPPAGLKAPGRTLWRGILADVEEGWELDARELTLLREAAMIADQFADLDAVLERDGVTVAGSREQVVVHPALSESRQLRLAQLRLVGAMEMTDPQASKRSATPVQARARRAAGSRWTQGRRHG